MKHLIAHGLFSFIEGKKAQKISFLKVQLHKQKLYHLILKMHQIAIVMFHFVFVKPNRPSTKVIVFYLHILTPTFFLYLGI